MTQALFLRGKPGQLFLHDVDHSEQLCELLFFFVPWKHKKSADCDDLATKKFFLSLITFLNQTIEKLNFQVTELL